MSGATVPESNKTITYFELRKMLYKDVDDFVITLQDRKENKDHSNIESDKLLMLFQMHIRHSHPELFKPVESKEPKKESLIKDPASLIYHPPYK